MGGGGGEGVLPAREAECKWQQSGQQNDTLYENVCSVHSAVFKLLRKLTRNSINVIFFF